MSALNLRGLNSSLERTTLCTTARLGVLGGLPAGLGKQTARRVQLERAIPNTTPVKNQLLASK